MMVVGLTGSIAAGKSEVSKLFAAADVPVFDADTEVHRIYAEKPAIELIGGIFPDAVVNGNIDRQRLAQRVLGNVESLKKLEQLIHPLMRSRQKDFISGWRKRKQNCGFVILSVPLLFETGENQEMDYVIVVSSSEDDQRKRALARPGMTQEKLSSILARQLPDSVKRSRGDFVIENSGSLEDLRMQVDALIKKLGELARSENL